MTEDCWICTTAPGTLTRKARETRCVCRFELQYHGYGHPHAMAVVGCMAFTAAPPASAPPPPTDAAQPTLFEGAYGYDKHHHPGE
jgi:hypothetical protein